MKKTILINQELDERTNNIDLILFEAQKNLNEICINTSNEKIKEQSKIAIININNLREDIAKNLNK